MKDVQKVICLLSIIILLISGSSLADMENEEFTLAGESWTIETFQDKINELFAYQNYSDGYELDEDNYYVAVYSLTDNGAHFFHIYHVLDGEIEMTTDFFVVTDGQIALATADSASIIFEEVAIALAFGGMPDTYVTLLARLAAKENDWILEMEGYEFQYYQEAIQLLIMEK